LESPVSADQKEIDMSNEEAINMIQEAHAAGMHDDEILKALDEVGVKGMRAFHLLGKALSMERDEA